MVSIAVPAARAPSRAVTTPAGNVHRVRRGETLTGIAHSHDLRLTDLIRANPQIADPNHIVPGQAIHLPAPVASRPPEAAAEPEPAPQPRSTPVARGTSSGVHNGGLADGTLAARLHSSIAGASGLDRRVAAGALIRPGQTGSDVQALQGRLDRLGYTTAADGVFGPRTEASVRRFQRDHRLAVDGVFGPRSLEALQRAERSRPTTPTTPTNPSGPTGLQGNLRSSYEDARGWVAEGVRVDPGLRSEMDRVMRRVEDRLPIIDEVARRANMPREMVAAIWYREDSGMRTDRYLHNGERLGRTTTLVPRGIYFGRDQFVDAAVHALSQKSSTARALGLHYGSTDQAAMAAFTERYNGFGYRNRGVPSAYVTAGSQHYRGGMYVADGRFSSSARDRRLGTLPIISEMAQQFSR